jgi:hypothetical protein
MKVLALLSLVATLALVSGCGLYHWRKPGASDADFQRDAAQCEQPANAAPDAFEICMKSRGWTLD